MPPEFHALSKTIEGQLREILTGFDWLCVHNVCSLNKNLAATSALRRIAAAGGLRLALWHHDLAWTTPRYRSQLHDGDPWDLLRTDWPHVVQVTVSEARRIELAGLLGVPLDRIRVIPNGIDPYVFLGIDAATSGTRGPAWPPGGGSAAFASGEAHAAKEHRAGPARPGSASASVAARRSCWSPVRWGRTTTKTRTTSKPSCG